MKWKLPRFLPWSSPFPLPRDTSQALLAEGDCENLALLLERYLAYEEDRGRTRLLRELTDRRGLVPDFSGQKELIEAHRARWERLASELGAVTFGARPEWRVVVGLGSNALLQGGISLHPIYSFPIIPASALKGVCRSYAERVAEKPADEVGRLFGELDSPVPCGDLVFLDGIPSSVPRVERDVINPVFGSYYQDHGTPPADYLSPKPIFFLAVGSKSPFRFGVASRGGDRDAALEGAACLQAALKELGVGAKSAAGYGYWIVEDDGGRISSPKMSSTVPASKRATKT